MAKSKSAVSTAPAAPPPTPAPAEYTVVARRYRPRQFAELIGQDHVAQSLINALQSGRVAHAYLFTGARGTGKTSAARILAKALNCVEGPTATPCDKCESCLAIAAGQDVDVSEIDGASNNSVDAIRELRQNVGFRPTSGRYKIYIIDEVHMLTTAAFNALLKTLEEPPPHVKFIFATTEVQKLPVTILSRCQRFDFAHVNPSKILDQLKEIVRREGLQADEDALRIIARRAAGSMRDSQSLLDQLLASAKGPLTVEIVHEVLGTSGDERVYELAVAMIAHDAKTALGLVANWFERGLQAGELADQLIEYWRALMLVSCGGPDVADLPLLPKQRETIAKQVLSISLDTILAGLDILSSTKARMRGSSHAQVLIEAAVVRLARLDNLASVGQLIQALSQAGPLLPQSSPVTGAKPAETPKLGQSPANRPDSSSDASKKNGWGTANGAMKEARPTQDYETLPISEKTLPELWQNLLSYLSEKAPILANHIKLANLPAIFGPNSLAIGFHTAYNHAYEVCASERNVEKIVDALKVLTKQTASLRIDLVSGPAPVLASGTEGLTPQATPAVSRRRDLMQLPLFKRAADLLGAQVVMDDPEFNPTAESPVLDEKAAPEMDPDEV